MSPFRWARKLFKKSISPSSSTSDRGLEPPQSVRLPVPPLVNSATSSLSTATESAHSSCQLCQQWNVSFPKASSWNDYDPMPSICIACIEVLSQAADADQIHSQSSSWDNYQTPFSRRSLNDSNILFCMVCVRTLPDSKFPDGRIVESCHHEPDVCLDCIEKSIVESLDNDLPQVIGCPQCGVTMSATDVWRFSGNETFQRYESMLRLTKEQECVICVETLRVSRFPEAGVTDRCSHESNSCLECISRHIQSQLESRMWDQLSCPECPVLLRYADVQKYATKETFQMYDFHSMKKAVSSDPNFRWCTAAECSSGQVHPDGAESPLMICNSCRGLSCFTHQSPWHEGMTCLEFDNPQVVGNTPESSNAPNSWGFRSIIANTCDWNREITVGGVTRKETDQEKRDRQLAMRLFKEQEEEEKKRLRGIEHMETQRVEAAAAEQQELERRAREQQQEIERKRKERERQAREAQQIRVRRQTEESASNLLLQTNTKACPGGCGWRIEKDHGCDHMTC